MSFEEYLMAQERMDEMAKRRRDRRHERRVIRREQLLGAGVYFMAAAMMIFALVLMASAVICSVTASAEDAPAEPQEAVCERVLPQPMQTMPEATIEVEEAEEAPPAPVGHTIQHVKVTHYCCEKRDHICGNGDGLTATGTHVTAGRTVAVDPSVIPYGSRVVINGHEYIAEDCGGAIKGDRIDVAVGTHKEALEKGWFYSDITWYEGE